MQGIGFIGPLLIINRSIMPTEKLPAWMDPEQWNDYLEVLKHRRIQSTPAERRQLLRDLDKIHRTNPMDRRKASDRLDEIISDIKQVAEYD